MFDSISEYQNYPSAYIPYTHLSMNQFITSQSNYGR